MKPTYYPLQSSQHPQMQQHYSRNDNLIPYTPSVVRTTQIVNSGISPLSQTYPVRTSSFQHMPLPHPASVQVKHYISPSPHSQLVRSELVQKPNFSSSLIFPVPVYESERPKTITSNVHRSKPGEQIEICSTQYNFIIPQKKIFSNAPSLTEISNLGNHGLSPQTRDINITNINLAAPQKQCDSPQASYRPVKRITLGQTSFQQSTCFSPIIKNVAPNPREFVKFQTPDAMYNSCVSSQPNYFEMPRHKE